MLSNAKQHNATSFVGGVEIRGFSDTKRENRSILRRRDEEFGRFGFVSRRLDSSCFGFRLEQSCPSCTPNAPARNWPALGVRSVSLARLISANSLRIARVTTADAQVRSRDSLGERVTWPQLEPSASLEGCHSNSHARSRDIRPTQSHPIDKSTFPTLVT